MTKVKALLKTIVTATAFIVLSCEGDEPSRPEDPTNGLWFPRRLTLTYAKPGFFQKIDTSVYEYEYRNDRIHSIIRNTRKWDTGGSSMGPLIFAGFDIEVLTFEYAERLIEVSSTLNGKPNGYFAFQFDNDSFIFPSVFSVYDSPNGLQVKTRMAYDDGDYLITGVYRGSTTDPLHLECGDQADITYTSEKAPLNQYTGFNYFSYKPFNTCDIAIDPIGIAFKWFRPSNTLIESFIIGGAGNVQYSYSYSNKQLTNIKRELTGSYGVVWNASIEY